MDKKAHYFYAISLPREVKEMLNEQMVDLKSKLSFKTWVHHEDLHITLAFLGHAPELKLKSSVELVKRNIVDCPSFTLTIHQLGVFGKQEFPRIFWADVQKEPLLDGVRKQVFSSCLEAGFELETRPFRPHITFARKWVGDQPFTQQQLENSNIFSKQPVTFTANEVVLYQTNLDRIPKYETIQTFPLSQ
ncbi:RNA 2',3'-cyclic phosphodiesterase [Cytobacillus sp. FJAT-54145]|uniref:RNA 2',3'-cyclic phosphodiesterase n=1 Tax=Cytobacillus spartinae TaxID=3299023 RepID=A0ABW6KI01_9BACI